MTGDIGSFLARSSDGVDVDDAEHRLGPSASTLSRARYKLDAMLMLSRRYQWDIIGRMHLVFIIIGCD